MQGKKEYQEKLFIRIQLSDYVPADNFYRRLKGILDLTFLYDTTAKYYGNEGQKSIDPVVFFKLMLVGYLENLNSDRRIIITSRMRMDILYFIGYDLDEELPWHSTLSRTRQLYGEETFTAIFKTVLKQCIDNGLVAGRRQAVDSVLVKANAALSSVVERQILDDAAGYGKELDAHTEKLSSDNIISLPDHLSTSRASAKQKTKLVNQARVSPSDTDARISYKPGKVLALNYLSQVSVDTSNHVITHIQAFHADKGDGQCLPEILMKTVNTLKENGLTVHEVLADSGYSSEPGLLALIEHRIEGYIPNRSGYKDDREGFTYDKEHDRYTCSQGKHLTFRHFRTKGNGLYKLYKTSVSDCATCPLKDSCTNPSTGTKVIRESAIKDIYRQMQQRVQSSKGRKMRKVRQGTVEPVLGTLVNFTGMKKVNTKGIAMANKCMIMAAVAYNLKKLLKLKPSPNKNSKTKPSGSSGNPFYNLITRFHRTTNAFLTIVLSFNRNGQTTYWSFAR